MVPLRAPGFPVVKEAPGSDLGQTQPVALFPESIKVRVRGGVIRECAVGGRTEPRSPKGQVSGMLHSLRCGLPPLSLIPV